MRDVGDCLEEVDVRKAFNCSALETRRKEVDRKLSLRMIAGLRYMYFLVYCGCRSPQSGCLNEDGDKILCSFTRASI